MKKFGGPGWAGWVGWAGGAGWAGWAGWVEAHRLTRTTRASTRTSASTSIVARATGRHRKPKTRVLAGPALAGTHRAWTCRL